MVNQKRSYAGKRREAFRRAVRGYCSRVGKKGHVPPCYDCPQIKGGWDCRGNMIGTREAEIAKAMAAVLELPKFRIYRVCDDKKVERAI